MATYVLVHGAWTGGWIWREVAQLLTANGHEVYAPSLTGLGDRVHLLQRGIGLEFHTEDIVQVLRANDLSDVVLVGWSLAGTVITAVAEREPGRIDRLVYLDADVPLDGEASIDQPNETAEESAERRRHAVDGWLVEPPVFGEPVLAGARSGWAESWNARTGAHPLACFEDPVTVSNPLAVGIPRVYIECTVNPIYQEVADRVRTWPEWQVIQVAAPHMMMASHPELTARILDRLATADSQQLDGSGW